MFVSSGVINILDKNLISIGTGFFATSEGLILTCLHVLKNANYSKDDQINFRFPTGNNCFKAYWIDESDANDDIAILKASVNVEYSYRLSSSIGYEGKVESFGYPNGKKNGIYAKAEVYGSIKTPSGFLKTQLGNANDITHGFSGAPIISESGYIIGIVSDIPKKDENDRLANIAFAIPSSIILNLFSQHFSTSNLLDENNSTNNAYNLIGRKSEILYYSNLIKTHNVTVIQGMAGVGKTTLATYLYENKIHSPKLWITIRKDINNELETVLYDLSDYLARLNYMKPINMFYDLKNSSQPYETALLNLQNEIIKIISEIGISIFIDDAHLINDKESETSFFSSLISYCKNNRFVFITRQLLSFISYENHFNSLGGLVEDDCKELIKNSGLVLSDTQVKRICEQTQGNAKFLELCIFSLLETDKSCIDNIINNLSLDFDINNYIQKNIMDRFTDEELKILNIIALCRKPISLDLLLKLSCANFESIYYSLDRLVRRNIVEKNKKEQYSMHALLKEQFSRLSSLESLQLHRQIAENIANDDYIEISYHYASCGRLNKALSILNSKFNELISMGSGAQMYKQIVSYKQLVHSEELAEYYYLFGRLLTVRGLYDSAIDSFNKIPETASNELIIQSYIQLSQCYEKRGEYPSAIRILDDVEHKIEKKDKYSKALIKINKGFLLCHMEKIYKGINLCAKGLQVLYSQDNKPLNFIADGYNDLGWNYTIQGNYRKAIYALNKSIGLNSNNARGLALAKIRLSRIHWQKGELSKALQIINNAEQLANLTGDPQLQAFSLRQKNLILWCFGEFELSLSGHKSSLKKYSRINDYWGIAASLENVAAVLYDLGQYDLAMKYIDNAINICKKIEATDFLAYAFLYKSRILIKQGDLSSAKQYAKDSIKLLKKWKYSNYYLGMAIASLGLVYLAEKKFVLSYFAFISSCEILKRGEAFYQYHISHFFSTICLSGIFGEKDNVENKKSILDSYNYFSSIGAPKFALYLKNRELLTRRNRL